MTSRREFIQAGVAVAALPAAMSLHPASAFAVPAGPAFHRVVYDARFVQSAAFGREAARLGETTVAIRGDITNFWYDELDQLWREKPVPIAGLTAHGPLFCLERWGWDAGLKVVFRAEHRPSGDGLQHRFSGPLDVVRDAEASVSGPGWGAQMARLATVCRQDICAGTDAAVHTAGQHLEAADEEMLISWVIAPVRRA